MGAPFCAYKPLIINEIIFKINENKFGNVDYYFDLYYVIRDMKREIFLEGIGWVLETAKFRLNNDGVVEVYTEYEILKPL
jgi:hypothetical protein